ncbi:MAG TPA: hypothetical protein VI141_09840 [Acidimicrobiia bacterium]
MNWKGTFAALAVAVTALATISGAVGPLGPALLLLSVGAAWRYTPRFWSTLIRGLAAGALAGVLILGPGFRIAMRVVSIMDPIRRAEFTMEGTVFIVIFVGAMLGGVLGACGLLVRTALGVRSSAVAGVSLGVAIIGLLVLPPGDIRTEFFELGGGPWVNIPLFGAFAVSYGIAAMAIADRLRRGGKVRGRSDQAKVPA